jgi:hypothetical protein
MMATPSAEIAAMIPRQSGTRPWHERVPPDVAAELPGILDAWLSGKFGRQRRTAARAIARWLCDKGVTIGPQGVETWLRQNENR